MDRHPSPAASSFRPAGPWALVWLGGIAAAAWLPLLLADSSFNPSPTPAQRRSPGAAITERPTQAPVPPRFGPRANPPTPLPTLGATSSRMGEGVPLLSSLQRPGGGMLRDDQEPLASEPEATRATRAPGMQPIGPLPGSVLLGGPLGLESLQEKAMVPAARTEQALRATAADRLAAVPLHWRPTMQALLKGPERILPAEVVRLPASHVKEPEEYPLVVKPDGIAETSVAPSPRSKQSLERWAERQTATPAGSVRPVIMVLEPIEEETSEKTPPSTNVSKAEFGKL